MNMFHKLALAGFLAAVIGFCVGGYFVASGMQSLQRQSCSTSSAFVDQLTNDEDRQAPSPLQVQCEKQVDQAGWFYYAWGYGCSGILALGLTMVSALPMFISSRRRNSSGSGGR